MNFFSNVRIRILSLFKIVILIFCLSGCLPAAAAEYSAGEILEIGEYLTGEAVQVTDRVANEFINRVDKIEKSDQSKNKTLKSTWRPHLKELENNLLPQLQEAAELTGKKNPSYPRVQKFHEHYHGAVSGYRDGLIQMNKGIRANSVDKFNQGYNILKKAVSNWQQALQTARELAEGITAQEGEGWAKKLESYRSQVAGEVLQAIQDYAAIPSLKELDAAMLATLNALIQAEAADPSLQKSIKKTWKPHLKSLQQEILPRLEKACKEHRNLNLSQPQIQAIDGKLHTAGGKMVTALQAMVKGIRKNSTTNFNKGYNGMITARGLYTECINELKQLQETFSKAVPKTESPSETAVTAPVVSATDARPAPDNKKKKVDSILPASGFDIRINPSTLAIEMRQDDVLFEGAALAPEFVRSFSSTRSMGGDLGPGWTHTWEVRAFYDGTTDCLLGTLPGGQFRQLNARVATAGEYMEAGCLASGSRTDTGIQITHGGRSTWNFDSAGRLLSLSGPGDLKMIVERSRGRIGRLTGPLGATLELLYNEQGLLEFVRSSTGREILYKYSETGTGNEAVSRLAEVWIDGRCNERYHWSAAGLLEKVEIAGGMVWKFEQGADRIAMTDPTGIRVMYALQRTTAERIVTEEWPDGSRVRTSYREGRIERVDGEGGRQVTELDPESLQVIRSVDANGNATGFAWDDQGRLAELTDPLGRKTRFRYQAQTPRITRMEGPGGQIVDYTYDERGNLLAVHDSLRGIEEYRWDDQGRLLEFKAMNGSVLNLSYGRNWLPLEYRVDGVPEENLEKTSAAGRSLLKDGLKQDLRDLLFYTSGTTGKSKDGLLEYQLDAMGRLSRLKFPGSSEERYVYDLAGRLIRREKDGRMLEKFTFDPGGRIETIMRADGSRARNEYDALDRRVRTEWQGAAGSSILEIQFDALSNPDRLQCGDWSQTRGYDGWNRKLSEETRIGNNGVGLGVLNYSYRNNQGLQRTETLDYRGFKQTIEVNPSGLVGTVESQVFDRIGFNYGADGKLRQVSFPNGLIQEWQWPENPADREGTVSMALISPADSRNRISLRSVKRDGLTIRREVDGRVESYTYDPSGQLVTADQGSDKTGYQYDAWGNRLKTIRNGREITATYHPDSRLATWDHHEVRFDDLGRLTEMTGSDGRRRTFRWDGENRLVEASVAAGGSGSPAAVDLRFTYDADGLLIRRQKTFPGSSRTAETTLFAWDGRNPLAELDAEGKLKRLFLSAPGLDGWLACMDVDTADQRSIWGNVSYIHRDERGSVIRVTDVQGKETASFVYSPFGRILHQVGTTVFPFRFTGARWDEDLDLYYLRARWYDPETGRFLTPDPVRGELTDSFTCHPYLYCLNRPLDLIDPLGTTYWEGFKSILPGQGKLAPALTETFATVESCVVNHVAEGIDSHLIQGSPKIPQVVIRPDAIYIAKDNPVAKPGVVSRVAGHVYAVAANMFNQARTVSKVRSGQMSVEEGRREVKGEALGASTGVVLTGAAASAGLSAIPGGVLVAYGANRVKDTAVACMEMGDARREALRNERSAKNIEIEAGMHKVQAIQDAIANNRFKEAQRLNSDLLKYAMKTSDKNADMYELMNMTTSLGKEIRNKREKESQRKEKEAEDYITDLRQRAKEVEERWAEEERQAKEEQQGMSAEEKKEQEKSLKARRDALKKEQAEEQARLAAEEKELKEKARQAEAEAARLEQEKQSGEEALRREQEAAAREVEKRAAELAAKQAKDLSGSAPQARPMVQGTMSGRFKGSSSSGSITLRVNGTRVGGSFSGKSHGATIRGSIYGTYYPETGRISAELSGDWSAGDQTGSLAGSISGSQSGNGFKGTGSGHGGESDFGTWSVSGGTVSYPGGK